MQTVKLGEDFRPSSNYKTLLYFYSFSAFILLAIFMLIPVAAFAPFYITLAVLFPFLAVMLFVSYWISRYYSTMRYKLTRHEMVWRRGVWFRDTGIVPYNRITNIDITQGPVSRTYGIASLRIQTAGYSGAKMSAEITIEGVEKFEEMREMIMGFVRSGAPTATESQYGSNEKNILGELVKIRKLLSKK